MEMKYDVIIPGGGLAGLTLGIQLKREDPNISILILESRDTEAATGAHKVGESTVELATHYFREVLDLKGYLEEFELPKQGLRFFFKTNNKAEISNRVEFGTQKKLTGADADIVIFDPKEQHTISAKTHHMNCDYNAYEGWNVTGRCRTTILRGTVAIENGKALIGKGFGKGFRSAAPK